jgi:membrane-bound serine protease (ClpP class)
LVLLALGLLLIFIEFYLPGAVMGVAGGIFVAASIFLFAAEVNAAWAVILYLAAVIVVLVYLVKFALWKIRTTKPDRSIYLDSSQEGYVASHYDQKAIGKQGTVLADLKPGGYILIDGVQHQALSEGGYLPKGSLVEVIGGQEESLIVKLIKQEGI